LGTSIWRAFRAANVAFVLILPLCKGFVNSSLWGSLCRKNKAQQTHAHITLFTHKSVLRMLPAARPDRWLEQPGQGEEGGALYLGASWPLALPEDPPTILHPLPPSYQTSGKKWGHKREAAKKGAHERVIFWGGCENLAAESMSYPTLIMRADMEVQNPTLLCQKSLNSSSISANSDAKTCKRERTHFWVVLMPFGPAVNRINYFPNSHQA